jgi:branched-chain amino acid transport system substrate-binding protein
MKKPVVITPGSTLRPDNLAELGDSILGTIGSLEYASRLDNPANKKFVANFKTKFGRRPDKNSAAGYNVASIILAALEVTGGDTTHKRLREAILGLKIETPQGPLSFTPTGICVTNRYVGEARKVGGEYDWWPIKTYTDLRDPRAK